MRALGVILGLTVVAASPVLGAPADAERGAEVFAQNCAVCHGIEARGDGPMARALTVVPPDLTALAAANEGVFPAAFVSIRIDGRSSVVSHGGEMPLFGRLFGMPDGAVASETGQPIITAQPIADVIEYLRSIQE